METILTAARASPLSRAQADEVKKLLPNVNLSMLFVETMGDIDKKTSLRSLGKTDFFTREIDEMLLTGKVRAGIHSAKDLPDPLPKGLVLAALTSGADPRDALVLGERGLFAGAMIATSSERREAAVRSLHPNLRFCDLRGTIHERLEKLKQGEIDGVVVAEAAIARLGLSKLNRLFLSGPTMENQGKLAIVVREDDLEAAALFSPVDSRGKKRPWTILHLGLDPAACPSQGRIYHYPVIRTKPLASGLEKALEASTHVLVTSREAAALLPSLSGKTVIAIGKKTAEIIKGTKPLIAPFAEQEGVIALLETLDLSQASVCYPRSSLARPLLAEYLQKRGVCASVIDLYETVFQQPGAPPDLDEVDELVFTSPSCVEGYRRIYGPVFPKGKKITPLGRITSEAIAKLGRPAKSPF